MPTRLAQQGAVLLRRRRHPSPGDRRGQHPCALARVRRDRGRSKARPRSGRRVRGPSADPGHPRPGARLRRCDRRAPRGRRQGVRGQRSAGPDAGPHPGRHGRGCGDRLGPALRGADGIRRTACGVHGHPRRTGAHDARPADRRLEGCRRQSGTAHGAADPRAAHPPRQGDEQHLHRAGIAGQHGGVLCGLSRPPGTAAHRASGECADPAAGAADRAPARARARLLLRHPADRCRQRRGGHRRPGGRAPHQPAFIRCGAAGREPGRNRHAGRHRRSRAGLHREPARRRRDGTRARCPGRGARQPARTVAAHRARAHPSGLQPVSQRDRVHALPQAP